MERPQLEDLKARIAELRSLDREALGKRVAVIDRRVEIEEQREQLARDCDADIDVTLLAIGASWSARLPALVDDPDELVATVLDDVRAVLKSLAEGWTPASPLLRRIRDEVITAIKAGVRPVDIRRIFDNAGKLVEQMQ